MQSRSFPFHPAALPLALACALPLAAQADDAKDLDGVVVTATRTPPPSTPRWPRSR